MHCSFAEPSAMIATRSVAILLADLSMNFLYADSKHSSLAYPACSAFQDPGPLILIIMLISRCDCAIRCRSTRLVSFIWLNTDSIGA